MTEEMKVTVKTKQNGGYEVDVDMIRGRGGTVNEMTEETEEE